MGSGPGRPIFLPVLHARADALVAGRGIVLHGEMPQAPGHQGHGAELTPGAGTVGILPVKPVLRAAVRIPVVRADKRHLHGRYVAPQKQR